MNALKRLFGDRFRVFFLAPGLFAILSAAVWAAWLAMLTAGAAGDWPTATAPHLWQAHEMIFGYAPAPAVAAQWILAFTPFTSVLWPGFRPPRQAGSVIGPKTS